MDLDHLKKLVDACHEEAESTNDCVVAGAALDAYLLTVEPARSLAVERDAAAEILTEVESRVRQVVDAGPSATLGWRCGWCGTVVGTVVDPDRGVDRGKAHSLQCEKNPVVVERDAYRAMVCDLLASAVPNERDHPSMSKQWDRARELLKSGPSSTHARGGGERDAARGDALSSIRHLLFSRGHCGDGGLTAMVERALDESRQRGRDENRDIHDALMAGSDAFPSDMEGTIAERVGMLIAERDQAAATERERIAAFVVERFDEYLGTASAAEVATAIRAGEQTKERA